MARVDNHRFRSYKNEEGEVYVRISDILSMLDKIPLMAKEETVEVSAICSSFKSIMRDLEKGHD